MAGAQQSSQLKELFNHKTLYGFQAAYYYDTMFGPLGASIGYSNHTREVHLFVNLGFEF